MFPDRSNEIIVHRKNAYNHLMKKDFDKARQSFFSYVESVRQQNINTEGKLERELLEAQQEYSDFVKQDPFYNEMYKAIVPIVRKQPGILQTDLYKLFPDSSKESIRYVLYFAADHGKLKREKKGRSYILFSEEEDNG